MACEDLKSVEATRAFPVTQLGPYHHVPANQSRHAVLNGKETACVKIKRPLRISVSGSFENRGDRQLASDSSKKIT
ncbi:hypothetical protein Aple_011650 [Acrocarpospora pleiomorpha]|uniref:Uncharacterized protein n=1 Tax=Acrocarpospora pleiomorpha TaxID=90975 RepID=A0A5M3XAV9_9ACTN|nr:hypothetical protein Aple_011650 [Acrocarpospora pleiomorpha]